MFRNYSYPFSTTLTYCKRDRNTTTRPPFSRIVALNQDNLAMSSDASQVLSKKNKKKRQVSTSAEMEQLVWWSFTNVQIQIVPYL